MERRTSTWLRRLGSALLLVLLAAAFGAARAEATNGKVLILDSTVSGGAASLEAQAAVAAGKGVDVVNGAQWDAMTTADFAQYDALVLGDPTCEVGTAAIAAAEANSATWSAAVDGNVILIGTDPVFHSALPGPQALIANGVSFAGAEAGTTGLYLDLSCYYADAGLNTPVPVLDHLSSFGTFQVRGQFLFGTGCPANSHIVATHPALAGLTDADLSNWSCSTHEAFDSFPADFAVLAINEDIGGSYVAPDGTQGGPYILARGKELTVISDISLTPKDATNPVGTSHTLTATVEENGTPVVGTTVTFTVVAGPDAGLTGTGVTDASGVATWSYVGTATGTDLIKATFVDSRGHTQTSDTVSKTWISANADLSMAKTGPAVIQNGTDATYTLTVSNLGPTDATNAVATDVLPAGESFVSASAGCSEAAGTVTCTAASIPNGSSATFTITVHVATADGALVNTATVTGDQPDPVTANNTDSATSQVNHAPMCLAASAGPDLWPPDHTFSGPRSITGVTDADGNPVSVTITSIRQDEPTNGLGDGDTGPADAQILGPNSFVVRAERSGKGDGRVYYIAYTATDGNGGSCSGTATIAVPHDQAHAAVGEGPLYAST